MPSRSQKERRSADKSQTPAAGAGPDIDTNYASEGNNEGEEPWPGHEAPTPPPKGEGPDVGEDDDA